MGVKSLLLIFKLQHIVFRTPSTLSGPIGHAVLSRLFYTFLLPFLMSAFICGFIFLFPFRGNLRNQRMRQICSLLSKINFQKKPVRSRIVL
jgi:hypothetical protein